MNLLFCFNATNPVVPLPKKGSRTIPDSKPLLQPQSVNPFSVLPILGQDLNIHKERKRIMEIKS